MFGRLLHCQRFEQKCSIIITFTNADPFPSFFNSLRSFWLHHSRRQTSNSLLLKSDPTRQIVNNLYGHFSLPLLETKKLLSSFKIIPQKFIDRYSQSKMLPRSSHLSVLSHRSSSRIRVPETVRSCPAIVGEDQLVHVIYQVKRSFWKLPSFVFPQSAPLQQPWNFIPE